MSLGLELSAVEVSANLPPHYELAVLETPGSALSEAAARAERGADEGTLVWVRAPHHAQVAERDGPLDSPARLDCALVIRPDYSAPTTVQLNYVAAVSAGAALAGLIAPLTELHYGWPNVVLLNRARIGHVELLASPLINDALEWLAVGLTLNVSASVAETDDDETSVCATGSPEVGAVALLESYARHFLSWINRWAENGFNPVRKHWLQRALGLDAEITVHLQRETVTGTLLSVDDAGAAHLRLPSGAQRTLSVAEFYGIAPA